MIFAWEYAGHVKGFKCVLAHPGWVHTGLFRHQLPRSVVACLAPLFMAQGIIMLEDGLETPLHFILSDDLEDGACYEQGPKSVHVGTRGGLLGAAQGEGSDAAVAAKLCNGTEGFITKAGAAGLEWSINSI